MASTLSPATVFVPPAEIAYLIVLFRPSDDWSPSLPSPAFLHGHFYPFDQGLTVTLIVLWLGGVVRNMGVPDAFPFLGVSWFLRSRHDHPRPANNHLVCHSRWRGNGCRRFWLYLLTGTGTGDRADSRGQGRGGFVGWSWGRLWGGSRETRSSWFMGRGYNWHDSFWRWWGRGCGSDGFGTRWCRGRDDWQGGRGR